MITKFSILIFISILSGCADNGENYSLENETPLTIPSQTAYPIPDSYEDLNSQAELTLKVELLSIDSIGELNDDGITSTLSTVEVIEVFKGSVETGDSLPISEPYHINDEKLSLVANYVPIEMDEPYLLFLSNYDGETWMIDYMGFGQYHFEKSIGTDLDAYSTFEDIRKFDFISDDSYELERYQTIREEVINNYY